MDEYEATIGRVGHPDDRPIPIRPWLQQEPIEEIFKDLFTLEKDKEKDR